MGQRLTSKLFQESLKCAKYWQSVLRFGLPSVILFEGINYAAFRMTLGNFGLSYPWRFTLKRDIFVALLASTLWWCFAREIAAWKRKNQQP
jgi:hypothetical protein